MRPWVRVAAVFLVPSLGLPLACGAPPPKPGVCDYAEYQGTCQLVSVEDFAQPRSPGDLRARYVTRGPTSAGVPETLVLRYQVEPRYHRIALDHLRDNPVVRCGVSHIRAGECKPTLTTLKVPELPGGFFARGDLQLEAR